MMNEVVTQFTLFLVGVTVTLLAFAGKPQTTTDTVHGNSPPGREAATGVALDKDPLKLGIYL
jgi:hypothetical protein